MRQVTIRGCRPGDAEAVVAAGSLFDHPPTAAWATTTLEAAGHHLLVGRSIRRWPPTVVPTPLRGVP